MAYTTINKSTDYFNTKLYTGNGSTQSITGVEFQPDWVWLKSRSVADSSILFDAVRGVTKRLMSNSNGAETTEPQEVQSFDSDGFTVGNSDNANRNNATMVAWNWLASNTTASNTDGSITSTVSANTTSGFSIVSYTGTGSNATVGHGLGVAPKMYICKSRSGARSWAVYNENIGNTKALFLNSTDAQDTDATYWNSTSPTNSVVSLGSRSEMNHSGENFVMYCFAEKTGYSKFGSYEGNNNSSDNTFIYTGFKPKFLIIRNADATADWVIQDNERSPINPREDVLLANSNVAEQDWSSYPIDLLSNGFKIRNNGQGSGTSHTFIYMAFGQSLVGSNNVPCTAR